MGGGVHNTDISLFRCFEIVDIDRMLSTVAIFLETVEQMDVERGTRLFEKSSKAVVLGSVNFPGIILSLPFFILFKIIFPSF